MSATRIRAKFAVKMYPRSSRRKLKADAEYDIVSVPWRMMNPS